MRTLSDLYVTGQRVVTGESMEPRAVHIANGKIRAVLPVAAVPAGAEVLDAGDLVVMPGIVDTHVHINDPGRDSWEGFETATRAAAKGGVTMVCDMPLNSLPSTVSISALHAKARALEGRAHVDVGLTGGAVPENPKELRDLFREGVLAFKCFLADSGVAEFSHVNEAELAIAMGILADVGAPLFVHAELPGPLEEAARALAGDPRAYATFLASRPKTAEDAAVDMVIRTCRDTRARAHIVHLSSSSALELVLRAKDEGLPFTAETCPHYLTFVAEDVPDGATSFKCCPPVRERENREKLWEALKKGVLEQVVTDHSPSTVDLKCSGSGDFMRAWGGISSLQLGLSAVWTEASQRGFSLVDLSRLLSAAPAKLVGLEGRKGRIAPGYDADLVFFDPEGTFSVAAAELEHKNKITPYEGRTLKGKVARTILRGETIYRADEPLGRPHGAWVTRSERR